MSRIDSKSVLVADSDAFVVVVRADCRPGEEVGWWKLLLVAGDDQAAAAGDRRDRFGGSDLAGLVEDDDVEVRLVVGQHLADDERAHHPAGLNRRHHFAARC